MDVIAGKLQEATMQGSKRPYGTSILLAGFTRPGYGCADVAPLLYRLEPSGAYSLWKACAIGKVRGDGGWKMTKRAS